MTKATEEPQMITDCQCFVLDSLPTGQYAEVMPANLVGAGFTATLAARVPGSGQQLDSSPEGSI
jgi:hypothetical protein